MNKAIFTIDVEDWFHAGVMQPYVRKMAHAPAHRLSDTLAWLADFLAAQNGKATFFTLSSLEPVVMRRLADLAAQGHEIASHGHTHTSLNRLSPQSLREELKQSKDLLEQASSSLVKGFRAPNFSITDQALEALEELGYVYDSSLNNVRLHKGYGRLNAHVVQDMPYLIRPGLMEFPLSTLPLAGFKLPVAGGAFLRHLPFSFFKAAAHHLAKSGYYHFYLHPWEVDIAHPEVDGMRFFDRMRHYRNIKRVPSRLHALGKQLQLVSIASQL